MNHVRSSEITMIIGQHLLTWTKTTKKKKLIHCKKIVDKITSEARMFFYLTRQECNFEVNLFKINIKSQKMITKVTNTHKIEPAPMMTRYH